jgi:hypothetical protein
MKSPVSIFLLIALGCASAGAPASKSDRSPQINIDSIALSFAVAGDSMSLGNALADGCRSRKERSKCLEDALSVAARDGYVKIAMGALNRLGAIDPEIRRTGHIYAHAIGIAAGATRRDITQTFPQCSESYQSGCYHGVIQAWFASLDTVSAADANALCAPFRKNERDRWIRFQCVHGMGHGLTMLYDHNLPKGLAG